MGLWGGIKRIGRGIGNEVGRVFEPIGSAIEGDWRGTLSGIGRNIKRGAQAGALFGKDRMAGVDVDLLGAAGGAVEGGLGPSQYRQDVFGETGGGGFAGALSGAAKGATGVAGAKALHHIGGQLGINERLGAFGDKVGITNSMNLDAYGRPDINKPLIRQEGETNEAFLDRERTHTFNQTIANRDRGAGGRERAGAEALMNDPRSVKIGDEYVGGQYGPDLRPGSWASGQVDEMIGSNTARLDKWNRENVPNIDPETGLGLGARLPQAPQAISAPSAPNMPAPQIPEDPGMGGVSALSRPGLPAPGAYGERPGPALRPPSGAPNVAGGTASASARDAVRDRMRSQVDRMRAASGGGGVDPGMRAAADDLGAEFDQRIAAAREQYGPGGFNVVKEMTPAEQAEYMAGVNRRQALLRGEDPGPTSSDTLSPGRLGAPQAISEPSAPNMPALNLGTGYATDGDMTPPPGYSNMRGAAQNIGNRFADWETGFTGPRNVGGGEGGGDPNRPWWRKGLDYVGENIDADTLVSAAGQLMSGGGQDDYYRRQAAVSERMMDLREQQAAYDQDRERLRERMLLQGSTSRWA